MSDAAARDVTVGFGEDGAALFLDGKPLLSGLGGLPQCTTAATPKSARGELVEPRARPSADVLEVIASIAEHLEPERHRRDDPLRDHAAVLVDGLLVRVVRGRGALDLAIGDGLAALAVGDRALRLGYAGIGDYARERLGLTSGTALGMAALARKLQERPLLRDAVRRGDVSPRAAQVVLPVARGDREAAWVERARSETVRALAAAVAKEAASDAGATRESPSDAEAARQSTPDGSAAESMDPFALSVGAAQQPRSRRAGESACREAGLIAARAEPVEARTEPADEDWERLTIPLAPEERATLDEALTLAGEILGAATPKWRRLEAICEEYLGAHPVEPDEDEKLDLAYRAPVDDWLEGAKAALEWETDRWCFLERAERFHAPASPEAAEPRRLDAELRELARMRERWDALVGHLAMLLRHYQLWRDMKFARFSHYCEERLGVATRAVEQRAALARRLYALPALREAMAAGRVSYEKARLVAQVADERTERDWIARAERTTCIALRRELEAEDDAQMCRRRELSLRVPRRVSRLLAAALRSASEVAGERLTPGRGLERIARHFVDTWKPALATRSTPQRRALARDSGLCQVPGCSRAAVHAHHVVYRSRGGDDDESNLSSLCAAHHLHGVHGGLIVVRGRAPHALEWRLALPGAAGVC